jgi:predicted phosphodiesterase
MRRFLQSILVQPVSRLANRFSSKPNLQRVHDALSKLYDNTLKEPGKKGLLLPMNTATDRFIIFSDQHKGAKNGSDDFMIAEPNYLAALDHYYRAGFHFISLGDSEELWENTVWPIKSNNKLTTAAEKKFLTEKRYTKVYGNHDVFWNNDPFAGLHLLSMYKETVKIYEGVVLQTTINNTKLDIFLTHGHQGDGQSDGNAFSAWFVSRIWAPIQSYLNLNPNTPAASKELKTVHNRFMYEWSKQDKNPVLITGHTHQPVFASLTHLERLYKQLIDAKQKNDESAVQKINKEIRFRQEEYDYVNSNYTNMRPYYFNTGCCCYYDGDITGIEIADGMIRLIKWKKKTMNSEREVLEEMKLSDLLI